MYNIEKMLSAMHWDKKKFFITDESLGNTNFSYLCEYNDKKYVFRIGTPITKSIHIDRINEKNIINIFSRYSFSADTLYFDTLTGDMLTSYIEGRQINAQEYESEKFIQDISKIFCTIHKLNSPNKFQPYNDIKLRVDIIEKEKIAVNENFYIAYQTYLEAKGRNEHIKKEHYGLCHNDTYITNFKYDTAGVLHLIDYEFAGMGDIFFDLACIYCANIGVWTHSQTEYFLTCNLGRCTQQDIDKLKDFSVIQLFWNITWAYIKTTDPTAEKKKFFDIAEGYIDCIVKQKK